MTDTFLTRPIFGDADMAQCFGDAALTRAMLDVEAALARAQGILGVIPNEAAAAISSGAEGLNVDVGRLEQGVAVSGVPIPALVAALREAVGSPHDDWVHWGATSQDIVDTGVSLVFRDALGLLETQVAGLIDSLEAASQKHDTTLMIARTRGQLATPITFGLRAAQWAQPLIAREAELAQLKRRILRVQFGGASGSQSVVAPHGVATVEALAQALGLAPAAPWHTDRSAHARLAGWLSGLVAACAKMAGDLILLGRSEIDEVRAGAGGGSSTMPQKSNPVTAEAIVSLSRVAQACEAGLSASRIHAEERDGAMWSVEWLLLPQLFEATAAALRHATLLAGDLRPNEARMRQRMDDTPEVLAEAAVFALAPKLGRQDAAKQVQEAFSAGEPLREALRKAGPKDIDWDAAFAPARFSGPAAEIARSIFAARRMESPDD
ncbi:MAG: lyase family protein [Octadecabacter sp.]